MNRRQLLQRASRLGLAAGAAWWLPGCRRPTAGAPSAAPADWSAAFLTDPHVYAEKGAAQGFARAVETAFAAERPPSLVLTGGDLAFDILETDRAAADAQFDLFQQPLAALRVPVHHTLGNHDCFGVYETSGVSPEDPLYGKKYFCQRFGLERAYYSFDHEGWHFVVLDTIGIEGRRYLGLVDDEQLAWLSADLATHPRPTVLVGHIPLFSNYIEWRRGTKERIPDGISVVNAHQVAEILARHPQVKLVLAGHLHIVEAFQFKGIEFANLGAVSGNWWNGVRDGFEEGYALLEFRGDQVAWRYVDYGWQAAPPPVPS